jgi:hypothetical protein
MEEVKHKSVRDVKEGHVGVTFLGGFSQIVLSCNTKNTGLAQTYWIQGTHSCEDVNFGFLGCNDIGISR